VPIDIAGNTPKPRFRTVCLTYARCSYCAPIQRACGALASRFATCPRGGKSSGCAVAGSCRGYYERQGCAMTKAKQQVLCATRREPIDSAARRTIAVRAVCHGGPKTRQWRSPVPQIRGETFPKCELPHTSRPIPERCCLRMGGLGRSWLANAGSDQSSPKGCVWYGAARRGRGGWQC
jgi:hypothetical protein